MTPEQFKAWFEGFCEAIDAAPTSEQWAKIKAKVADIREKPLVNLRDDVLKRCYDRGQRDEPPLIVRGQEVSFAGIPIVEDPKMGPGEFKLVSADRGHAVVKTAGLEPEFGGTRVIDRLTGADLGPSD